MYDISHCMNLGIVMIKCKDFQQATILGLGLWKYMILGMAFQQTMIVGPVFQQSMIIFTDFHQAIFAGLAL